MASIETPRLVEGAQHLDIDEDATRAVGAGTIPANQSGGRHSRGHSLGRYVILDEIGSGGMGVVYAAYDPELDRRVAVKVLRHAGAATVGGDEQTRLLREAQAMAKLSHPNVLPVFDVGTVDGRVFITAELVEGSTLSAWMRSGSHAWREVLRYMIPAGRGLAAAHAAGLVHRDFKPSNVLISKDGSVRVMDFGLARQHGDAKEDGAGLQLTETDETSGRSVLTADLTRDDVVVGTPPYMAPEQHLGETVGAAADQYSFCVTLYRGLYGQLPFGSLTGVRLIAAKRELALAPLAHGRGVPGWLHRVVIRGLDPDPAKRWPSMKDLLTALDRDPRRTAVRVAAGSLALAVALTGGWVYGQVQERQAALCSGAADNLANTWDATTEERIRQTFASTGVEHAHDTWTRVKTLLDGYSQQWVHAHQDACEATHIRQEQSTSLMDLRMACLGGHLRELSATTALLAHADDQVLQNAVAMVSSLPSVEDCNKLDRMQAGPPPPTDDIRQAVDDVAGQIARIKVLDRAGKHADALPLAESALEAAKSTGYDPVVAQAQFMLGVVQHAAAQFEAAAESLAESSWLAEANEQDDLTAQAQVRLLVVVGKGLRDLEEGLFWGNHARAAVRRLGPETSLEGDLEHALGDVYQAHGDFAKAFTQYEKALATLTRVLGPDHHRLAAVHLSLAVSAGSMGNNEVALEHYRRGAVLTEKHHGSKHPSVGEIKAEMRKVGAAPPGR